MWRMRSPRQRVCRVYNFAVFNAGREPQVMRVDGVVSSGGYAMKKTKISFIRVAAGALGAISVGSFAIGAMAAGALAIGALAIGRLTVGRLTVRRSSLGLLEIGDLTVGKLRVSDLAVTSTLTLPATGLKRNE